jgi:hypothetical protein
MVVTAEVDSDSFSSLLEETDDAVSVVIAPDEEADVVVVSEFSVLSVDEDCSPLVSSDDSSLAAGVVVSVRDAVVPIPDACVSWEESSASVVSVMLEETLSAVDVVESSGACVVRSDDSTSSEEAFAVVRSESNVSEVSVAGALAVVVMKLDSPPSIPDESSTTPDGVLSSVGN